MNDPQEVTLDTLAGGAAAELFQREWERVLENITDVNTDHTKTRTVTLTVKVTPASEARDAVTTTVEASSKLIHAQPAVRSMFIGKKNGRMIAVDRVQFTAFPDEQRASEHEAVTPISIRKEA
jgi:hypothetical protein